MSLELEDLFICSLKQFIKDLAIVFYDIECINGGNKYVNTMNETYLMRNWTRHISKPYKKEIDEKNIYAIEKRVRKKVISTKKKPEFNALMLIKIMDHLDELTEQSKINLMQHIFNITQIISCYNDINRHQ
jgi:hypothetical protein